MTGMKDYADQILDELEEVQEQQEPTPDNQASIEAGVCPFCHGENFYLVTQKTSVGRDFFHKCPCCERVWVVSFNSFRDEVTTAEIDFDQWPGFPGGPGDSGSPE
jgi:transposase-like protein